MVPLRAVRPVALAVGGMLSLAIAVGIGRFVYTPILPVMVAGLGLDQAEAGFLASSNFVGYLLGAIVMSLPGLPGRRRSWAIGGLALSVLTTVASGLGSTMPALLAIRFAGGAASGLVFVSAIALVVDALAEAGQGRLSALLFAGPSLGILLSSILVAVLIGVGGDWRALWFGAGALGAALTLGAVPLLPRDDPSREPAAGGGPPPLPNAAAFARAVASYGLFGFAYVVTATFIVAMTRSDPRLAPVEWLIWPVVGLVGLPSVAFWNGIARRFGPGNAYAAACLVEAGGVALGTVWASPLGILLAAVCLGATFVGVTALGFVVAKPFSTVDSRRLVGVMTVAFGIGQIVGPTFAGAAHTWTGSFALPSYVVAGALVLCAVLVPRGRPGGV